MDSQVVQVFYYSCSTVLRTAYNVHFTQFDIQGNNSVAHFLHVEEISVAGINSRIKRFMQHWDLSDVTE